MSLPILARPGATFLTVLQGAPSGLVAAGSVGVRVSDMAGGTPVPRQTAGIVEAPAGSGCYLASPTAPSTTGLYLPEWDTGSVSPGSFFADDPLLVSPFVGPLGEPTDVAVSTRAAAGAIVAVSGAVDVTGDVTVVAGDDYAAAAGRALVWSSSAWPDLTGAAILLALRAGEATAVLFTASGLVTVPSATVRQVRVELTHAQTGSLRPGVYGFQLVATLPGQVVETLADGRFAVEAA